MNYLDLLFGIPLLWFAYKGFSKGLIVEIASLAALVGGVYLAVHFSWYVGAYIEKLLKIDHQYVTLVSFTITFLGVVVLVHLIGKMGTKLAGKIALGLMNKLFGALFGFLKVAFIISIVLYLYGRIDPHMKVIPKALREESLTYEPIAGIAPVIIPRLEAEHAKYKESKRQESP
ncbi:MAG: CvpA family protein [Bacteroidales bacterium]